MAESGKVKFYNTAKAFGFIQRPNDGDVFFHKSDLRATGLEALSEGQAVTFSVIPGKDGKPKAINVLLAP